MVEARVEVGPDLVDHAEREGHLGPRDHGHLRRVQLEPTVRPLRTADGPLHLDDRLARKLSEEREERGVGGPLLERDLGRSPHIPDEGERDAAEGAVLLEMTGDADGLAVQRAQFTR